MKGFKEIYKKSIAMQLKELGNPIHDAKANLKNPKMVIYIFEDTNKLRKDFDKIQKNMRSK